MASMEATFKVSPHRLPNLLQSHLSRPPPTNFPLNPPPTTRLSSSTTNHKVGRCFAGGADFQRSTLESLFCYDKAVPEEKIEKPVGLAVAEKAIGGNPRCGCCEAKGVLLCVTCSGSGLYVDAVLESQGVIVKVRCLGCGGTGNIMCSECGGRGHL